MVHCRFFLIVWLFLSLLVAFCDAANGACADMDQMRQLAIRYLETSNGNVSSDTEKIVPTTVVVSGLLDAGFDVDEPLVQTGLEFLENSLADDGYVYSQQGKRLGFETARIRDCFQTGLFPHSEKQKSSPGIRQLFLDLQNEDDDENIARALDFVDHVQSDHPGEMVRSFLYEDDELVICRTSRFAFTVTPEQSQTLSSVHHEFRLPSYLEKFRSLTPFQQVGLFLSECFQHVCVVSTISRVISSPLLLKTSLPTDGFALRTDAIPSSKTGYVIIAQTNCRRE